MYFGEETIIHATTFLNDSRGQIKRSEAVNVPAMSGHYITLSRDLTPVTGVLRIMCVAKGAMKFKLLEGLPVITKRPFTNATVRRSFACLVIMIEIHCTSPDYISMRGNLSIASVCWTFLDVFFAFAYLIKALLRNQIACTVTGITRKWRGTWISNDYNVIYGQQSQ